MTTRSYSILIDPERSGGSIEELAERLGPLTRYAPGDLAGALERGPVTVETDLRREEAERICRQLERREAPAEIRDDEGDVVARFGPGAEAPDEELEAAVREALGGHDSEGDHEGAAGADDLRGDTEPAEDATPDEEPEAVLSFRPAEGPPDDGGSESPDSREDGGGEEFELTFDDTALAGEAPRNGESPPLDPDGDRVGGGEGPETGFEAPENEGPGSRGTESPEFEGVEFGGEGWSRDDAGVSGESDGDSGFDSAGMSEILENGAAEPESDRTSAAFEDRPAHVPVLAAFLSAVAPGAGQVYNGDADRAWEFAGRALLVLPWVQSVRDALRRARAVREGDVDRPERGSLKRALTHVGILWSALLAVVIAGWLIAELVEGRWGEPTAAPGPTAAERRARALREAELTVHEARLTAWERTGEQPVEPKQRYTMSESERARRLYGIGWEHCRARKLAMCESAMRKVSELDSQYRRAAYRLQVWASVRRKEGGTNPSMPSVRPPGGPDAGLDAGGRDVAADAGVASPEGPDTVRTGRRDGSRGDGPRP